MVGAVGEAEGWEMVRGEAPVAGSEAVGSVEEETEPEDMEAGARALAATAGETAGAREAETEAETEAGARAPAATVVASVVAREV